MENRIKEYRARYNYSQQTLANLIQVSRQTIGFIEKHKMIPSTVLALKLAKVFDCKVEDLFSLREDNDKL
ncbi:MULTISPECIES: helix-turn-helix transcriptional regulator [unclassified Bacillus (in: firmicutes)]|uniref:helix-turn-helix transcriptional regulator n=1 Tax=unclassified Bacillus (in: firmicutes) TaxID=185979 RepID=UPI001BECD131|nr:MULTISPECIES: helix-turn-helix transcriptional regulator [unclassified Bacillus (in: firmicutes)]MBT2617760.1 helix-turn-helix transcriptional regulator [Bacillus sp. ISL-78]MBT2629589.1 helix-turn-helix transcriptional regulator [Bacillus sp. ISL-101]